MRHILFGWIMEGLKKFAVYEKKHASGNIGFRVDLGRINGKRTFQFFSTRASAEKFRQRCLTEEAHKSPSLLADINAVTRHEILGAVEKLKPYKVTLLRRWISISSMLDPWPLMPPSRR